jgi:hypothetical protein
MIISSLKKVIVKKIMDMDYLILHTSPLTLRNPNIPSASTQRCPKTSPPQKCAFFLRDSYARIRSLRSRSGLMAHRSRLRYLLITPARSAQQALTREIWLRQIFKNRQTDKIAICLILKIWALR